MSATTTRLLSSG